MQLNLFPPVHRKPFIEIPEVIHRALLMGATLLISISGGKDSQAMLNALVKLYRKMGYTGKIITIFADLGRIEWLGVKEHCDRICAEHGIQLIIVRRPQGGMVDQWEQRMQSIAAASETVSVDKPFWSDSSNRYCTSDQKRSQIDREIRKGSNLVVCAVGIRADESDSRKWNPIYCVRSNVTTSYLKEPSLFSKLEKDERKRHREEWADQALDTWLEKECKGKLVFTWNAIHEWTIEQVWSACGTSSAEIDRRRKLFAEGKIREALLGCLVHWAYISSNTRLSCAMCVLASMADIINGAIHNPLIWLELAEMEIRGGWGFRKDLWLASLAEYIAKVNSGYLKQLWLILVELGLVKPMLPKVYLQILPVQAWSYDALGYLLGLLLQNNPLKSKQRRA